MEKESERNPELLELEAHPNYQNMTLADFPSLRDLETSNMRSRINHNVNLSLYLQDSKRMEMLEGMNNRLKNSEDGKVSF
jgi:hypothetical protein